MVNTVYIRNGNIPELERSISCIGFFDGMHKGHQKLIEETVNKATERGFVPSLICFSPDPDEVIFHKKNPHLFSDADRYEIAASFGISRIIVIEFNEEFMNLDPVLFIENYIEKMNIEELVCGFDFSFGRMGKGDPSLLKEKCSCEVTVIDEKKFYGSKISSTRIKEAVRTGNFELARKLLGFPYYFIVSVVNCAENDGKYLISARIADEQCIVPKNGNYSPLFEVKDGIFRFVSDIIYHENDIVRIETLV